MKFVKVSALVSGTPNTRPTYINLEFVRSISVMSGLSEITFNDRKTMLVTQSLDAIIPSDEEMDEQTAKQLTKLSKGFLRKNKLGGRKAQMKG